jgi:hypothetical protein
MAGPIDIVYVDGVAVAKGDVRTFGKVRSLLVMADATEVANADLSLQLLIVLKSNGRIYKLNTLDTTTAPDGTTFLRDVNGLGFELVVVEGLDGRNGATVLVQDAEPDTDYVAGSIWIDADSTNLDLYTLTGSPLAWVDSGVNLKGTNGVDGTNGIDGASALTVVRVAATTNVTIASALENGDSLDGVTLATNDLVLLTGQSTPAENGVYVVAASGAASRAAAFATYNDHPGRYFSVMEGTAGADKLYRCTSDKGGTLGSTAIVISEFAAGGGREKLTTNRTYYVRTDGSDSNDGLSNASGGAFLTVQKAVNVIFSSLDLGGFDVTIQLGTGTFTGNISVSSSQVGAGKITINGDTNPANTGNYIVTGASGATLVVDGFGSKIAVQGVELRGATHVLLAQNGGYIQVSGYVRFGAAGAAHMRSLNGFISAQGITYAIVGAATQHYLADQTGLLNVFGSTINVLAGTFNFSTAFAFANRGGVLTAGSATFSLTGTVTGVRYSANNGGGVDSAGGGANFFPGNSAGSTTSPGWYI